jgi:adenylosuccinate lyase
VIPRYSRPEMTALWTDDARLKRWLQVECAHLRALEQLGQAPEGTADVVERTAVLRPERVAEIEAVVKHDVIAFLTMVEESVGEPARLLHRGLTSSDVLDTSLAMLLRDAGVLLQSGLRNVIEALGARAREHRHTYTIGRSHGMHAEPTTFGLVLAGHMAEFVRAWHRLSTAIAEISVGTLSGAVGTYAQTPPEAETIALALLGLRAETVPTQVVPRDRHAAYFVALASVATAIERLAINVRHLQRSEVGEAQEAFTVGQRGSSAMPHKKNPILSENLCGLSRVVRGYADMARDNVVMWHERDISHSSVERYIAPDATVTLDFMLQRTTSLVKGLVVHADKMAQTLDMAAGAFFSGNVLLALVDAGIARQAAYGIVQRSALAAVTSGGASEMQALLRDDEDIRAHLDEAALARCFDLRHHLRHADLILDRALAEAAVVMSNQEVTP